MTKFSKFSDVLSTFTSASAIGNIWCICFGNILRRVAKSEGRKVNLPGLLVYHFFSFLCSSFNWSSGIASLIVNYWLACSKVCKASTCFFRWSSIIFIFQMLFLVCKFGSIFHLILKRKYFFTCKIFVIINFAW